MGIALCDLAASINLITQFMMKKLSGEKYNPPKYTCNFL